jgi:L-2-amino-thiazoline-4-carboxylic acid hydrolase
VASPLLDQVKIQAQVLVPVLQAFREEFGAERANRVAWKALENWRREFVRDMMKALPSEGAPVERWRSWNQAGAPFIGDAVDFEPVKDDSDSVEFNITGCRFAQFFRELREPELEFALLCSFDNTAAEEVGEGDVKLNRTQTIMQGADHCDFRYQLKKRSLV